MPMAVPLNVQTTIISCSAFFKENAWILTTWTTLTNIGSFMPESNYSAVGA